MSAFPTIASSTPLSDWFANVNQLAHVVQQQANYIQNLQTRIAVLENQARIIPVQPVEPKAAKPKVAKAAKVVKAKPTEAKEAKEPREAKAKGKKRGRKAAEVNFREFLREGEQVIARIPLGDRRFDEHAATVRDGKLVLEDGQVFDHPTTLVGAVAKMLEDIGERSSECSKSLNGWMLCSVSRDGKRIPLEKLKPAEVANVAETIVEA
jgi:hypothetical protein